MSLQAHRLACTRGDRILFRDLSLSVASGNALWVRGSNGSGKTSLLRLLCGLAYPDEGEVHWHGKNVRATRAEFGASLAYIGHAAGLKDDLLAWENLSLGATLSGNSVTRNQAIDALEQTGLADEADLPVRVLSQGQRKRVALARLHLSSERPLWVLDEPFTALDHAAVDALRATLGRHLSTGGAVVYTTHQEINLPGTLHLDMDSLPAC